MAFMRLNYAFIREVGPVRWIFRTAIRQFYKRILKRDHRMRLPGGEWINLPISNQFASEAFITKADVDWGSERLFESSLRRAGVFLDVGAHIGYYSLYVLPSVLGVYSFEPDPRVRKFLEQNVNKRPNLEVIPCAVAATQGKARFTLENVAAVSHLSETNEVAGNLIEVDVVTIDAFVASRDLRVEAIKIDAEGHDIEVIRGSLGVLAQQAPLVLTEAIPDEALFEATRRVAYRVFAFVRHPKSRKKLFMELFSNIPTPGATKMLFLVPGRLAEEFVSAANRI
jgi:FkbM family methyltransferase